MPAAADRKQRRGTFPDEEQGTEPLCRFAPEAKPPPARDHSGRGGNAADLILRIILDPRKNRSKCRQFCCCFRNCLPGAIGNAAERADRTARWGRKDRCDGDTGKWGKKRSMLWIRSPARCRTRRPMFCWRMAPPWKRQPICLPSAVWLLSVMVGGDVRVAARITELVRALLDLSANRICVEQRKG